MGLASCYLFLTFTFSWLTLRNNLGAYTFAGSWDPRPGSYYSVSGSWVRGNGSRYSGSGSNETRHMKIRLDINLDPGPICSDPYTQTQIPRPKYPDPYIGTHIFGPMLSMDPYIRTQMFRPRSRDPYFRTHMSGPKCSYPYFRTQMFRPGTRDPYTQTHETESIWRQLRATGGNWHWKMAEMENGRTFVTWTFDVF